MSASSMTELNPKGSFFWDWENLVMLNSKELEVSKKLQLVDPEIETMEALESGHLYSSSGVGTGGSASDLGYVSSSKSLKSASFDSSTNPEAKESKFTLDDNDSSPYDLSFARELPTAWSARTSLTMGSSAASVESLIGLKLGKRMYFEDVSAGSNSKTSPIPVSPAAALNRSKSSSPYMEIPHCQVEGCNLDLSSAKEYHRKHRVCESHSKSPKVIVGGLERRFCQQCSRFHKLSEFDQKKRSCRKRLSDHNARRRKSKPNIMQFGSRMLPSYDGRHQMGLAFNEVPLVHTRSVVNSAWDRRSNSKLTQAKLDLFPPTKTRYIDELHLTSNELLDPSSKISHDPHQLQLSKGTLSEVFHRGLRVYTPSSNEEEAQDHGALSLLSTNSWVPAPPNPTKMSQPLHNIDALPILLPPASMAYWQGGQPVTSGFQASYYSKSASSHFQEFQLFKEPQEPNFYLY
ncbi:hypothetical protein Nepgr_003767 [Nepenthes gracilis]|uniref:SBP-type domain-containing protein n=1 Tax=Nepenthes gracilis TaxID=150966 RepID=A0AAD3S043_NEPGR|nr:hypothetical protein Nepgr_003767 [Nepenthes gracilis]